MGKETDDIKTCHKNPQSLCGNVLKISVLNETKISGKQYCHFSLTKIENGRNIALPGNDSIVNGPFIVANIFNDYVSLVATNIGLDGRMESAVEVTN